MSKHTPCDNWQGALDRDGYGRLQVGDKWALAHRVFWERVNGEIPKGLVIDHLCRNRCCVNVEHMEVVTPKENTLRGEGPAAVNARKTHCHNGHRLADENLMITRSGGRYCRECGRSRWRQYRARKIEEGTWTRT